MVRGERISKLHPHALTCRREVARPILGLSCFGELLLLTRRESELVVLA